MALSELLGLAQALRDRGYEARNLAQEGITVWKDGHCVFLSADDVKHLNADVSLEVEARLRAADPSRAETVP